MCPPHDTCPSRGQSPGNRAPGGSLGSRAAVTDLSDLSDPQGSADLGLARADLGTLRLKGPQEPSGPCSLHFPLEPPAGFWPDSHAPRDEMLTAQGQLRAPRPQAVRFFLASGRVGSPSPERQQGDARCGRTLGWGGRRGQTRGCGSAHTPLPGYPSRPASQDQEGREPPHGPAGAGHGGGRSGGLFVLHLVFLVWSPVPKLGQGPGKQWGWGTEEEGALAGVWLRKGIGPGCTTIPGPCLAATFWSGSALTC